MPLYEIAAGELVPFRRLHGSAQLYESQIEDLLWDSPEEFLGEPLFRIGRQRTLPGGGRPDIIALDNTGRVVVIEVKRDVDRGQLAQCLEYAGWARGASLDELAGMYYGGQDSFFAEWQTFTESLTPTVINRSPRLVLVAHDFHGRTEQALQFLIDNGLPVTLVRVSIYEDSDERRFLDVEGEFEPQLAPTNEQGATSHYMLGGRRVQLADLVDAGVLVPGDKLSWTRPKVGDSYQASVADNGAIKLPDGRAFASPSRAAMEAAEVGSYDGWWAWRVDRLGGELLKDVRARFIAAQENSTGAD